MRGEKAVHQSSHDGPQHREADGTTKDGLIKMLLKSTPLELSKLGSSGKQLELSQQTAGKQLQLSQLGSSGKQLTVKMPNSPYKPVYANEKSGGGILGRVTGQEKLVQLIQLDHPYAKPWRPESSNTLPTKTLFINKVARSSNCFLADEDELINVDSEPVKSIPAYDPRQARKAMSECNRFVEFANNVIEQTETQGWEETVPKEGWTQHQKTLYSKMLKILHLDRLSRLAQEGRDNEPVLRRITVEKSSKRARTVLSCYPIMWDTKSMQWLHSIFCNYLPRSYLAAWLDILQTLRSKVPTLIDRMILPAINPVSENRILQIMGEGLALLVERPWDPAISIISRQPLEKLPGNPVIIVAPPGPGDPRLSSRRHRLWNNQLGCLGKVIMINVPLPRTTTMYKTSVNHYLYQLVSATLAKVRECKGGSSDRPVVLMGWGPGAAIAAHVAGLEKVCGVVCLGFPSTSLSGYRGDLGDTILDLKSPTLFVVGEKSKVANTDDIEALREKLSVETGLVIVGAADNNLRISKRKQRLECVTQSMVDRSIMEEIREFLVGILGSVVRHHSGPATFAIPSHDNILSAGVAGRLSVSGGVAPKKVTKGRKRNSSASADGSAPSSPAGKKSRPVTPGSAPGSGGSTPVKLSQVSPGFSGPPAKKPRKPKKSLSTESTPDKTTGFPVQGLGSRPFPPGLLSISTPLPQSTLDQCPDSPPPLPIRVPLSMTLSSISSPSISSSSSSVSLPSPGPQGGITLGKGKSAFVTPSFNPKLRTLGATGPRWSSTAAGAISATATAPGAAGPRLTSMAAGPIIKAVAASGASGPSWPLTAAGQINVSAAAPGTAGPRWPSTAAVPNSAAATAPVAAGPRWSSTAAVPNSAVATAPGGAGPRWPSKPAVPNSAAATAPGPRSQAVRMLQHAVVGQQPVASPQTLEASPQHTIVQPPTAAKKHIAPQQPITVQQQPTALLVQQPTATQQPTVFHPTVTPVPRLAAPMSGPRPTQRVIQYAAKNSKAHSSPNPVSVPPTTPTWSLTGSRPEPAARPGQTNLVGLPPTPLGHPAVVLGQNNVLGHSVVQNKEKTSPEKKNDKQLYIISVPAGEAGKTGFAGSIVLPTASRSSGGSSLQITPVGQPGSHKPVSQTFGNADTHTTASAQPTESKMSSPKPLVRPPGCSITPTVLPLAAGRTTSSPAVRLSPVNSSAVGSSPGVLRHSGPTKLQGSKPDVGKSLAKSKVVKPEVVKPEVGSGDAPESDRDDVAQILASLSGFMK